MKTIYYTITKKDLFDLFGRLSQSHRVMVPYVYGNGPRLYFDEFDPQKEDNIELGGIRQDQPVKTFINPARERMSGGAKKDLRPIVLAGVKGCDLSSLVLQDFVFLEGDVSDPFYADNRNKMILIGHDCTCPSETCFCLAMEGAPYPQKYFDISLAAIDDYFLVEISTAKGSVLVSDYKTFFKDNSKSDLGKRQANRDKVAGQVQDFIDKRGTRNTAQIKGAVENSYNLAALWQDSASTCVECGACNMVCPTCHCFLLFDEKNDWQPNRHRIWDACLYKTFARVAGGANPRRHLYERLRNRFDKKFTFFPKTLNYFACTGCGRCIEACPGNIDIREVLKGAVSGQWNKPPHK